SARCFHADDLWHVLPTAGLGSGVRSGLFTFWCPHAGSNADQQVSHRTSCRFEESSTQELVSALFRRCRTALFTINRFHSSTPSCRIPHNNFPSRSVCLRDSNHSSGTRSSD